MAISKYYSVIPNYDAVLSSYELRIYYLSGQLKSEGKILDKVKHNYDGTYKSYYENGQIAAIETFKDGLLEGMYKNWYPNGKKKLEGEYVYAPEKKTTQLRIYSFWNTSNVMTITDGNGDYYSDDETLLEQGPIKNGVRDGNWSGENHVEHYTFTEKYNSGVLVSGTSIDAAKVEHPYTEEFKKPVPKGGFAGFYKYVGKNFRMPDIEGLSGKVMLSFIVDKEGNISDIRVTQNVQADVDREAIRVLKKSPRWQPCEIRGIKSSCSFTIPINITAN